MNTKIRITGILFAAVSLVASLLVVGCGDERAVSPDTSAPMASDKLTISAERAGGYGRPDLKTVERLQRIAAQPDGGLAMLLADRFGVNSSDARRAAVVVPAGSVDALADALTEAGPNGVVILESGLHTESGMVTISQRVDLLGEPGAVLEVDTAPASPAGHALRVHNASRALIWGIEIRPKTAAGGTGILVENAPDTWIGHNTIVDHVLGVVIHEGDQSVVFGNTISVVPDPTEANQLHHGILVAYGERVHLDQNDISGGFFGVWASDRRGFMRGNTVHENYIGILLCTIGPNAYQLPSGERPEDVEPSEEWLLQGNVATDNSWGYLTIDGAHGARLVNNTASNNSEYDMELGGESLRFGEPGVPGSYDNLAIINDPNLVVKVCGENNKAIGGNQVDTEADPCY